MAIIYDFEKYKQKQAEFKRSLEEEFELLCDDLENGLFDCLEIDDELLDIDGDDDFWEEILRVSEHKTEKSNLLTFPCKKG